MPFTPNDMTASEKTLLATVTAQMITKRGATTPDEIARATSEAQQTAGEMIWAERGETTSPEPEEPFDEYLTWYYAMLQLRAEMGRLVPDEDESSFIETEDPPG